MRHWLALLIAAALIASGCTPEEQSKGSTGTSTTGSTPTSASDSQIPENLKHAGYLYSGASSDKPVKFKLAYPGEKEPTIVEQTIKFSKLEKGNATFDVVRNGPMADKLGNEVSVVQPDGVYTVTSTKGRLEKPILGLPADLKVGSKWKRVGKLIEPSSMTATETSEDCEVVAEEKVVTAAGTFDALKIVSKGYFKQVDIKSNITSTSWYARDIGLVKLEFAVKDKNGADSGTLKLELTP
ncbi:MAG: hypothetical protein HONBIEJF_00665 [Fimbriimonadaceae bacterium]|nr:hypothetical protein [Fimbriimonadaceae bacterium]